MVLVYQEENEGVMTEIEARRREQRRVFQQNLLKEGLQLELEPKESSFDGKTFFLKLHIPWKIKVQYAEVMGLKLPTKKFRTIPMQTWVRLLFCKAISYIIMPAAYLIYRFENRMQTVPKQCQSSTRDGRDGPNGYTNYTCGIQQNIRRNRIFITT